MLKMAAPSPYSPIELGHNTRCMGAHGQGVGKVQSPPMPPTRVLLIDDHAMFLTGLHLLLRSVLNDLEVHKAGSIEEALQQVAPPQLILLDVRLQGLNGLDGMALLQRRWPKTPIVVLTADPSPDAMRLAMEQGASAFVSKEQTADDILSVVKQVLAPSPADGASPSAPTASQTPSGLTPRQCEVLDQLCQGLTNKAIGRKLGLAENTVRVHVQAILAHLGVSNRSEAVFAARRKGLVG